MVGVDTLLHRLCFHPSFDAESASMRVGFQNEGSAPGEDGDEPPELAPPMLPGEGGVNESSPARRSADVASEGMPARASSPSSTSPPAGSIDTALAEKVRAITSRKSEVVE